MRAGQPGELLRLPVLGTQYLTLDHFSIPDNASAIATKKGGPWGPPFLFVSGAPRAEPASSDGALAPPAVRAE